jgi:hypothetical protein
MFRLSACKVSAAASALLLCAGLAQAQTTEPTSPLSATWTNSPAAVQQTYNLSNDTGSSAVLAES